MAIFDERATGLPQPDVRGLGASGKGPSSASATQKGVEGVQSLLGVALQTDATQATENYRKEVAGLEAVENTSESVRKGVVQGLLDSLPDNIDKENVKGVNDRLNALSRARNMSSSEFDLRREAMLRSEIDRRPHLSNEFRAINNAYSGTARARSAAATAQKTAQEKGYEAFLQAAHESRLTLEEYTDYQRQQEVMAVAAQGVAQNEAEFTAGISQRTTLEGYQLMDQIVAAAQDQETYSATNWTAAINKWQMRSEANVDQYLAQNGMVGEAARRVREAGRKTATSIAEMLRSTMKLGDTEQLEMLKEQQQLKVRVGLSKYAKQYPELNTYILSGINNEDISGSIDHIGMIHKMIGVRAETRDQWLGSVNESLNRGFSLEAGGGEDAAELLHVFSLAESAWNRLNPNADWSQPETFSKFRTDIAASLAVNDFVALAQEPTKEAQATADRALNAQLALRAKAGIENDAAMRESIEDALTDPRVMGAVVSNEKYKASISTAYDNAVARLQSAMRQPGAENVQIDFQYNEDGNSFRTVRGMGRSRSERPQFVSAVEVEAPSPGIRPRGEERKQNNRKEIQAILEDINFYGAIVGQWDLDKIMNLASLATDNSEGSDLAANSTESQDPQG